MRTEGDWTFPDGLEHHEQPAELHQVYFNDPIIGTSTVELEDQFGIDVGLTNRSRSTFNDATFDGGSYRMEIPMVTNTLFKANDSINAFVEIKLRHLTACRNTTASLLVFIPMCRTALALWRAATIR